MKSFRKALTFRVPQRMGFVNITGEVQAALAESGVREGLCLVNAMHITASVFINDDEPGLHEDYRRWLERLAPFDPSPEVYHHNRTGEDNGDAHHKRQLMGREVVVAISEGRGRGDKRLCAAARPSPEGSQAAPTESIFRDSETPFLPPRLRGSGSPGNSRPCGSRFRRHGCCCWRPVALSRSVGSVWGIAGTLYAGPAARERAG
jgi:secondary thiamine-phosphate synthase enzyme